MREDLLVLNKFAPAQIIDHSHGSSPSSSSSIEAHLAVRHTFVPSHLAFSGGCYLLSPFLPSSLFLSLSHSLSPSPVFLSISFLLSPSLLSLCHTLLHFT
ncbi:hypothetical protein JZ751_005402, partial [Albula glossodonta]